MSERALSYAPARCAARGSGSARRRFFSSDAINPPPLLPLPDILSELIHRGDQSPFLNVAQNIHHLVDFLEIDLLDPAHQLLALGSENNAIASPVGRIRFSLEIDRFLQTVHQPD